MEKKKRKLHPLVIVLIVVVGLMLLLCAAAAGLWLYGQSSINRQMDAPKLEAPVIEEAEAAEPEQPEATEAPTQSREEGVVSYNGKNYRYNENMRNFLLMGIDSHDDPDESLGTHVQADVLVLAALDMQSNTMTLISVSRDTMCDFAVLDENGEVSGSVNAQLALSYAYGDGAALSCELTRDAVSNIFYGLPIQGYGAYYMNGIAELNDAVGGVTVTVLDDYPFYHLSAGYRLWPGQEVTLTGREAELYIRCRLEDRVDANELRMKRQKQYLLSLISTAKQVVLSNPGSVLSMYDAVDDYIVTDLDIAEISYLATKAAGMDFSGDLRSLSGELQLNDKSQAELYLDKQALFELMLEVFYTEIPAEG